MTSDNSIATNAALLLGLASALGYGITDYLAGIAGRAVGIWRSIFYGDLAALAVLSIGFARPCGGACAAAAHASGWAAALGAGVVLLTAALLLTRGLTRGTLAVVAPVTASYGALAAVLSAASGERLSVQAGVGIVVTACGVCAVSVPASGRGVLRSHLRASGFGWAAGAAVCYAVGFWLQGRYAVPALGPLIPVAVSYGLAVAITAIGMPVLGLSFALPERQHWGVVLGAGLCSAAGNAAMTIGQSTGRVAIVIVLSTLASAVTVLLSRFRDRTAVAVHQWLAMSAIIAGLILIKS
jgi:drug/metabolite transporter (DMT)-like permease